MNKNVLIYGGIGLGIIVIALVVYFMMKKRKKAGSPVLAAAAPPAKVSANDYSESLIKDEQLRNYLNNTLTDDEKKSLRQWIVGVKGRFSNAQEFLTTAENEKDKWNNKPEYKLINDALKP